MNIIAIFIPIVIIIGIAVLVRKTMNSSFNKKGNYSYSGRVRKIFIGYLAILLVCVVLDALLPVKELSNWKTVSSTDIEKESSLLNEAALSGKIAEVNSKFLVKKWSLDYSGQKLNTEVENNEFIGNMQVVVERKNSNDGKMEAAYYRTRSSMDNLDITELDKPIDIKLKGNQVTIIPPSRSDNKFTEFTNVFPINQFTGKSIFSHHSDFNDGLRILYLRIPKDLEITTDELSNINIEFVK